MSAGTPVSLLLHLLACIVLLTCASNRAGLTCPVTIKFTPKTRDDIQDRITVLAQTGPVEIPINCFSKKAVPVVNTPVIELGKVTMGETGTANLILENKGALAVALTLSAVDFGDEDASGPGSCCSFSLVDFLPCVAWGSVLFLTQTYRKQFCSLRLLCWRRIVKSACLSNSVP
jgi:hypothetical protein